jgi:geranylgeranyl diphosphate synthase, type I
MSKNLFLENLKISKKEIDKKLEDFFEKELLRSQKTNSKTTEIISKLAKFSLNGGKRIRPILTKQGFEMFKTYSNYSDSQTNFNLKQLQSLDFLQLSLEIFQTFCLIHDDIIDSASTRRGFLTIHKQAQKELQEEFLELPLPQIQSLSLSYAILAGDYAHFLADEFISRIESPNQKYIQELFYEMQFEVTSGQIDDTFGVGLSNLEKIQQSEIINMLDYKSGRYSIEKPFLLGIQLNFNFSIKSILSWFDNLSKNIQQDFLFNPKKSLEIWQKSPFYIQNLDKKLITNILVISKICKSLGLIFQIKDDILGLFGNEKETGKSNFSDLEEGKRTLILVQTYQKATLLERKKIKNILAKESILIEDLEFFKQLCQKYEILEYLNLFCFDLDQEIENLLSKNLELKQAEFFRQFKTFLVERKF